MQYLKGTPSRRILFERNESVGLEAYIDVDFARSIVDRRSTSSYCTFLGGNVTRRVKNEVWYANLVMKHSLGQWHKGSANY